MEADRRYMRVNIWKPGLAPRAKRNPSIPISVGVGGACPFWYIVLLLDFFLRYHHYSNMIFYKDSSKHMQLYTFFNGEFLLTLSSVENKLFVFTWSGQPNRLTKFYRAWSNSINLQYLREKKTSGFFQSPSNYHRQKLISSIFFEICSTVQQPNGHTRKKEEGRESAWLCLWTYLKSSEPIYFCRWYLFFKLLKMCNAG